MAASNKLGDELKSRLRQLASLRQRSSRWSVGDAPHFVERDEAHESFKQEALAAWMAYQETGRHLPGQETRFWLSTWGMDAEAALPSATIDCHRRCRAWLERCRRCLAGNDPLVGRSG